MNELTALLSNDVSTPPLRTVLLCVLLAFVLCQVIAAVYVWTYQGLSYSRAFVLSLVMGGVVSSILVLAIGDSVARGLGLLGALALVRFRATLKDTRDMVFVFACLSIGVAVGVQAFSVAIVGTVAYAIISAQLALSNFGSRRLFDGLLRFQGQAGADTEHVVRRILGSHCASYVLVNLREVVQGSRVEFAYQVKLTDPSLAESLVAALRGADGIGAVGLMMQDHTAEV
jgi:hypothetical protein